MDYVACPQCQSEWTYYDGFQMTCSVCAYEWQQGQFMVEEETVPVLDVYGAVLSDGDAVVLVKDLKVKGSSMVIKQGTKVKGIRLQPGEDHNLAAKVEGVAMNLKSQFVKKV